MSLKADGQSISIFVNKNKVAYGYSKNNSPEGAAEALRGAVEEFIKSEEFNKFTTTSLHNSTQLQLDFLVHTSTW
jgi:hypothetical protein